MFREALVMTLLWEEVGELFFHALVREGDLARWMDYTTKRPAGNRNRGRATFVSDPPACTISFYRQYQLSKTEPTCWPS